MTSRIVDLVTAAAMDGDTELERELNALLTATFIGRRDVPANECLPEAQTIIANDWDPADLNSYLQGQFGPVSTTVVRPLVAEIIELLTRVRYDGYAEDEWDSHHDCEQCTGISLYNDLPSPTDDGDEE